MRIIGCDLHARQQTVAMLDTTTGELAYLTLMHEGNNVRESGARWSDQTRQSAVAVSLG
jgi:hypothetical protein